MKLRISLGILLFIGSLFLVYSITKSEPNSQQVSINPTNTPTIEEEESAREQVEKPVTLGSDNNKTLSVQPEISRYSQENGLVQIYAFVKSSTSGKCTATLTNGSETLVSKTVDTELDTSYYRCLPMEFTTLQLANSSKWIANVTFKLDDASSKSDAFEIEVKK